MQAISCLEASFDHFYNLKRSMSSGTVRVVVTFFSGVVSAYIFSVVIVTICELGKGNETILTYIFHRQCFENIYFRCFFITLIPPFPFHGLK